MKFLRSLIAVLLLTFTVTASAGNFIINPYMLASVGGGGSSNWSCTDASILCESFDSTGYDSSWTEELGTGNGAVNEDTLHSSITGSLYCVDYGEQAVAVTGDSVGGATYTERNFGSDQNGRYYQFFFNPGDLSGLDADGEIIRFAEAVDSSGDTVFQLRMTRSAGVNVWETEHYHDGSAIGTHTSNTQNPASNTWYRVRVYHQSGQSSAGFVVKINDITLTAYDSGSTGSRIVRAFRLKNGSGSISGTVYFDSVKVHTSEPGACSNLPVPVAYWDMENNISAGSFTSVVDVGGNGQLLSQSNSPSADNTTVKQGSYSINFSPAGSYTYRTDTNLSSNFPLKSGTTNTTCMACAWVYPTSNPDLGSTIFAKYDSTTGDRQFMTMLVDESGTTRWKLYVGYNGGASADNYYHGTNNPTLNQWYMVCGGMDGSNVYFRVRNSDGSMYGTDLVTTQSNAVFIGDAPIQVGGFNNSATWTFLGRLDGVRVYDQILSESQVTKLAGGD